MSDTGDLRIENYMGVEAFEGADAYMARIIKGVFDHRADLGRDLKRPEAAMVEAERALIAVGGPPEGEAPSAAKLLGEANRLREQAAERGRLHADYEDADGDDTAARLGVGDAKNALREAEEAVRDAEAEAQDAAKALAEARKAFADAPDPTGRLAEIETELATVEEAAAAWQKRSHAQVNAATARATALSDAEKHAATDKTLTELRALRASLLDGVDVGVEGLTVEDGELRAEIVEGGE